MQPVAQSCSNLLAWICTWTDDEGGVHGPVVHHHVDQLRITEPDTWSMAPLILGLLNLHTSTGERQYLSSARLTADYLVSRYLKRYHVFRNSNHEHKPLGTPAFIGNALPSLALSELYRATREEKYLATAVDNFEQYVWPAWNEKVGCFVNPQRPEPHLIHNMNSMAMCLMISLCRNGYDKDCGSKVEICAETIRSYQVKSGGHSGSFPYWDGCQDYISLYTALTAYGMLDAYSFTQKQGCLESALLALRYLGGQIHPQHGLLRHYNKQEFPLWIPDTLFFLSLSEAVTRVTGEPSISASLLSSVLSSVLSRQHASGGFPLCVGFCTRNLRDRPEPKKRKWRDILPTPGWNCWNLWSLSSMIPPGHELPGAKVVFPSQMVADPGEEQEGFLIVDDLEELGVFESSGHEPVLVYNKKEDVARICLLDGRDSERGFPNLSRKMGSLPAPFGKAIYRSLFLIRAERAPRWRLSYGSGREQRLDRRLDERVDG